MNVKILSKLIIIIVLVILVYAGICVGERAYHLASSYYSHGDNYVSDEIYYVDTARRYLINIFKIKINYYNMSGSTDSNYFNLEHPPLGKYIIALAMVTCGDKPVCWRLPGIIEASLLPLIIGLASYRVARLYNVNHPEIAALIGGLAAASNRIVFMDGSVALLDIHMSFFGALSLLALAYDRPRSAVILGVLSSTVKMTGVVFLFSVFIYYIVKIKSFNKRIIDLIIVPLLVILLVYLPLIYYFGPIEIIKETIDALKWFSTSRPPGPPVSGPLGWLVNSNPFYFNYNMVYSAAVMTPLVSLAGFASSLVMVGVFTDKLVDKGDPPWAYGSISVAAVFLLFGLLYALGNHTFYSFYAVVLVPGLSLSLAEIASYFSSLEG